MNDTLLKKLRERAGQYDEYDWHREIELEAAKEIERLQSLVIRAGEWGESYGDFDVRHCCGTHDYRPHRNGCEYADPRPLQASGATTGYTDNAK